MLSQTRDFLITLFRRIEKHQIISNNFLKNKIFLIISVCVCARARVRVRVCIATARFEFARYLNDGTRRDRCFFQRIVDESYDFVREEKVMEERILQFGITDCLTIRSHDDPDNPRCRSAIRGAADPTRS